MRNQEIINSNINQHLVKIDVLKAIAIIAVVFFHIGYQEFGYLGVDIFLVINGFLIMRSILKSIEGERFSYIGFLLQKVLRLWPLVLIAGTICIVLGFFTMLPDDYENLAQSIFASNLFANNILACITTKNYWDVVNEFKPLMHTWYLGVIVQSYLILPIIPMVSKKVKKNRYLFCNIGCIILMLISLTLYLSSSFSEGEKFYYFPFRLFELMLGAIVACSEDKIRTLATRIENRMYVHIGQMTLICLILVILFVPVISISNSTKLLFVCVITTILVILFLLDKDDVTGTFVKSLGKIGECTLSIFVWHQIILAFLRYTTKTVFTIWDIVLYLVVVMIVSAISYCFIEKPLAKLCREKRGTIILTGTCFVICTVVSFLSLTVHFKAGVVRDVPELNISVDNIYPNMHAQYCDRGYQYDKEFSQNDKTKVLVIGNSFGRDWINILLESSIADRLDISYIFAGSSEEIRTKSNRLKEADYIFYGISYEHFGELPEILQEWYEKEKVYIIGNKNFGDCNGIIYNKRNKPDYYQQSVFLPDLYYSENARLKEEFSEHYIDMIGPVQNEDGSVKVFTTDGKFISQDCRHLTQSGAKYYASILDLSWILQ